MNRSAFPPNPSDGVWARVRFGLLGVMLLMTGISAADEAPRYAIVIHGGAGSASKDDAIQAARRRVLDDALTAGVTILDGGGTSLDAVETVIRVLEDSPLFNAGRGAVPNAAGEFELDASIMNGADRACGAVGGVRTVKNPISLARLVMTETPHILLVGPGTDAFADTVAEAPTTSPMPDGSPRITRVENTYFAIPASHTSAPQDDPGLSLPPTSELTPGGAPPRPAEWDGDGRDTSEESDPGTTPSWMGTVGCVALDTHGHLAAGTSTGGLKGKQFGRVGDSPIIGAGNYADDRACAVSCTGVGEDFIRTAAAYDIAARMRYTDANLDDAARATLAGEGRPLRGGLIAVDREGRIVMTFTTAGMARAAADSTGRREVFAQ